MQVQRYLLKNRITAVINEQGIATEYKPVYQRNVTVYKGIDNKLQFKLINQDQKPIDTSLYEPRLVVFDENNNQIIDRVCTVLDDGSSNTKGLFEVDIFESEIINIKQQYLSYNVYLVESSTGNKIITYSEINFRNGGILYVSGEAFPGPVDSIELTENNSKLWFKESGVDVWYSGVVDGQPEINGNEALHSAVVYPNDYVGNLTIQAALTNQISGGQINADNLDWTDIKTVVLDTNKPTLANFTGIFDYIRFKTTTDPTSKINKILIRN